MLAAMVYTIWMQRNRKVWSKDEINKEEVVKRVKYDVCIVAQFYGKITHDYELAFTL